MNHPVKKLALALALVCALGVGFALPASAAGIRWPWQKDPIPAESLEPGDYAATMTVGTSQQLAPIVLPTDATDQKIVYQTENEAILTVDKSGMVRATGVGTARIAAACGEVACVYTINVLPDDSMVVSEMDITLSANRIGVGDVASLQVQVLPSSAASYAEISLTSSNEKVATVNNFGKVTGVAPGTATITATCGKVTASATVTVVGAASSTVIEHLSLSTTYVVLKPGASKTVTASVTPSSASKNFTFKSGDKSVAQVNGQGVITAVGVGTTTVVVSNGTASASVTVIVNQTTAASSSSTGEGGDTPGETDAPLDPVVEAIRNSKGADLHYTAAELPTLTPEILNELRITGARLYVAAEGYTLRVEGSEVRSTNKTVSTAVVFTPADKGLEFTLNDGASLPGDLHLELSGEAAGYSRLYLYNETTGKWQYLNSYRDGVVTADTPGRYLLTNETLSFIQVNWIFLGGAALVVVAIGVVYIVFKKRYWFW